MSIISVLPHLKSYFNEVSGMQQLKYEICELVFGIRPHCPEYQTTSDVIYTLYLHIRGKTACGLTNILLKSSIIILYWVI